MIRTLDLFCGGGGSSYGARAAGASIICGVDANPLATAVFKANFPGASAVTLRMTDSTVVGDIGRIGPIDLLLASPECTNHTCARGSRPREEESRGTARYVLKFASALTPRWLVIENVVSMRSWSGYQMLLEELGQLGYHSRIQTLDASRFGVPQARRRLFIICDRYGMPSPVTGRRGRPPHARSILDPEGSWLSRPLYRLGRASATIERAERGMSELGRRVPFLIVYYGSDGSGGWQPLDRPLRTITTLDRFGLVTWKGDAPMLRMLQVTELRRGMGLGDDYADGDLTRRERIRLLGNGVAPPVMTSIVETLSSERKSLPLFERDRPFQTTVIARRPPHPTMPLAADARGGA